MIDFHIHILPGVDDGARDLTEAIAMAMAAHEEGVRTVVATPHHGNGIHKNHRNDILEGVERLRQALKDASIPLEVLPGSEIHLDPGLMDSLESGELLPVNDNGHTLLLELPTDSAPKQLTEILFKLGLRGMKAVLAHPERNSVMQEEPERLYNWVRAGGLVQITAGSLTGDLGDGPQRAAETYMRSGWVHILASDRHDARSRPGVREGFRCACRIVGTERAQDMVSTYPARIIEGLAVSLPTAAPVRRRFWELWIR